MKIAVEGCCHGEFDAIYSQIHRLETRNNYKVDLLLICGDFQAIRNVKDLQCMAVPNKYKQLGYFHKYYTGEKVAPMLTIVIGGNHEASNYMWELYHGGWLAPNIYFLGHAGCVQVNGIRIAGASGIFKAHDFRQGHHEKVPYDFSSVRSIYHIREYCVRKLSLLSSPQIFLSHDWPRSIEHFGDLPGLLRRKKFLREDIESGSLGSPPLMGLLNTLKPDWWFAAHLHARFEATVVHEEQPIPAQSTLVQNPDEITIEDEDEDLEDLIKQEAVPQTISTSADLPRNPLNPDEISLDDEENVDAPPPPPPPPPPPSATRFLALDKCLPNREYLEVIDYEMSNGNELPLPERSHPPPVLSFDPEWLAISRAFHPWLSTTKIQRPFPVEGEVRKMIEQELEWVLKNVPRKLDGSFLVSECQAFVQTAPGPEPGHEDTAKNQQPSWYTNPQTVAFCAMLEVMNKINPPPFLPESFFDLAPPHGSLSPSNAAIPSSPTIEPPAIDSQLSP